ncbi:ATP-binding protein [Desulfolithobacter sp.]
MKTEPDEIKHIRKQILIPVGIVLVSLLVLLVIGLTWLQHKHISASVNSQVHAARKLFRSSMSHNTQLMDNLLRTYADNPAIIKAFRDRNRSRLARVYSRINKQLRQNATITSFAVLDTNGKVFYRSHQPDKFGDTLYHFTQRPEEVRPGKIFSKTIIGVRGRLKLRVLYPLYQDGQLLGYLAHAKGIDAIARDIKQILGVDLLFLARKSILANSQIKERLVSTRGADSTYAFNDYLFLASTLDNLSPAMVGALNTILAKQQNKTFTFSTDKRVYAAKSAPLVNADQSYISDIILLNDITAETTRLRILTGVLAVCSVFLGSLLFILFYRYTSRIQGRLITARKKLQEEIEERKKAEHSLHEVNSTLAQRVDERTRALQQANRRLQASTARFQAVMDSLDALVYVADMETHEILFINRYGAEIWGDITGKICWQTLQSGQDGPCEFCTNKYLLNEDGTPGPTHIWEHQNLVTGDWFECRDQAIHWTDGRIVRMEIATNINRRKLDEAEKKSLQNQLIQAQKMESIGRLTGGIAHDFNNFLTPVIGYCELLLMRNDLNPAVRKSLEAIQSAGRKAGHLVEQLLALSRKQILQMQTVHINTILHDMTRILSRIIGEDIAIELFVQDDVGPIQGDAGQLEQIIMNLAVNARDAMPEGGKLIFETGSVVLDENYTCRHPEISPGNYTMLCVTDTGKGIPREVQDRIFDPFFTTKQQGKGTGLGLATVYGIVKQHQGHIFVYSEPEIGTTFKIYFPLAEENTDPHDAPLHTEKSMPGGRETILVVDDEESVRQLLVDTLAPLGYTILEAATGEEAVELVQTRSPKVDLLLTDVIMPGMNGKELATRLQAVYPRLKVLFISGYTDNLIVKQGVLEPGIQLLSKPVIPSALTARLREILDR